MINPKMKVVFVSHNDLDGGGPIIIGKNYFEDCKFFNVSNGSVDKIVKMVLYSDAFVDRELVLITDVSVTDQQLINHIDKVNKLSKQRIMLFDHHGTAIGLNQYDWAHVTQEEFVSGTKLFWNYMQEQVYELMHDEHLDRFWKLDNLVNKINDWDTWKWKNVTNDDIPRQLSELYSKTGINYFLSKYVGAGLDQHHNLELFTPSDMALTTDFDFKEQYLVWPGLIKSARTLQIPIGLDNIVRTVKCVSVNDNPGDKAELLYEEGVDFVFMFYHSAISIRSRVDDVDLGAWAKDIAGGGGHKRSAGFPITKDTRWILDMYLDAKFN
jgi:oligoribonuclease NrnB/cAMP/cGMP phosphodiesterase (DHH superfamily)